MVVHIARAAGLGRRRRRRYVSRAPEFNLRRVRRTLLQRDEWRSDGMIYTMGARVSARASRIRVAFCVSRTPCPARSRGGWRARTGPINQAAPTPSSRGVLRQRRRVQRARRHARRGFRSISSAMSRDPLA